MCVKMPTIKFIDQAGTVRRVEVERGESVMEGAIFNGVPEIDADCGGAGLCGTCHVYVREDWTHRLPPISPTEEALLEVVCDRKPNSRLACMIKAVDEYDGLVVTTPVRQRPV